MVVHKGAMNAYREMPRTWSDFINVGFEEGQLDEGVNDLESMRCSSDVPSESHIRQLFYLALDPTTPEERAEAKRKERKARRQQGLSSAQTRTALVPERETCHLALNELHLLLRTHPPAALSSALPSRAVRRDGPEPDDGEDASQLAREGVKVRRKRDVWECLGEGAMKGKGRARPVPVKGTRARRAAAAAAAAAEEDEEDPALLRPVGERAWPAVGFLVSLFEADEQHNSITSSPHSPFLLSQFSDPKHDVAPALRVLASAFLPLLPSREFTPKERRRAVVAPEVERAVEAEERTQIGRRLLKLILNLVLAGHVDPTAVFRPLVSLLVDQPYTSFSTFVKTFPHDYPIALCHILHRLLSALSGGGPSTSRPSNSPELPRKRLRPTTTTASSVSQTTSPIPTTASAPPPAFSLALPPNPARPLTLAPGPSNSPSVRLKFALGKLALLELLDRLDVPDWAQDVAAAQAAVAETFTLPEENATDEDGKAEGEVADAKDGVDAQKVMAGLRGAWEVLVDIAQ